MCTKRDWEDATGRIGHRSGGKEWVDALRTATDGVVSALSSVHESLVARGMPTDRVKVVELTTAIAQLIQVQEGINHKLFKGLLQITLANDKFESRIASLEHILDENSIPSANSLERHRQPSLSSPIFRSHSRRACSSPKCTSQSSGAQFSQATKKDFNGFRNNREHPNVTNVEPADTSPKQTKVKSVPERNVNAVSTGNYAVIEDSTGRIVNKREGPSMTTPRPIKRQRLRHPAEVRRGSKTQVVPAPILVCEGADAQTRRVKLPNANVTLPALPTLRDVEAEIEESERRRRTFRKPQTPACDKCRVRKRADMLRQRGYIDENVFDRWAARPGGCLGYVHMDEPGAPPSPLSFPETPTCSPPEAN